MVAGGAIDYLAGIAGGLAVCIVGHPFDTIKTRLQTSPEGYYRSTMDCVRKTARKEGLMGFYAGVTSPLAGQMFFRAFSFFTFYRVESMLNNLNEGEVTSNGQLLVAGGMTGFAISFIETPIDLVKTKLQIQIFQNADKRKYSTTLGAIQYISSVNGPRALWQGMSATVIRNVPSNALFFPVNEIVKRNFADYNNISVDDLEIHHRLGAGACGGLSYWVGMYPLDRIKGAVQAQRFHKQVGYLTMVSEIYAKDGILGFYRGITPCAARAAPACAAMFAVVDLTRKVLTDVWMM